MAVSFVSKTIQSSPYVLPLDLNLFSRVMDAKQQQFNQGAAKAQAGIDSLGNLDVMRSQDREYLNNKINGLVQGINSLGGVDYSDAGIQNQIEGLGSDIYGDNNVLTAVSSTKSARNLINQYENFKTNPKLKGYYSEVNEWYDKRRINEWLQNPNVGAQYQGPSSATPYNDYKNSFIKALEKVKADQNVTLDDRGLYIDKTTNREVSPERIQQLAQDLLTPEQRSQMKRDATFLYTQQAPQSPQQLVNRSIEQYNQRVNNAEATQRRYEHLASAAVNDPLSRQNYLQLAQEQKSQVAQLKSGAKSITSSAVSALQNDPEELMYQLYSNDFNRGLSNMFSYRQTDRSVQADQGEMFQLRQAEDARQFNLTYNQRDRLAEERNSIELFKAGLKYESDMYGRKTLTKIPAGQAGSLETLDPDTGDPNDKIVTEVGLKKENQQTLLQMNEVHKNILSSLRETNPNMFDRQQSSVTPGGWLYSLRGQQDLEGLNSKVGFQMDDLANVEANRKNIVSKGHLSDKDIDQLSQWYKDYQALSKGDKPLSGNLPPAFIKGVEEAQLLNLGYETNKQTINAINSTVSQIASSKAKLTEDERNLLTDYNNNPSKYREEVYVGYQGGYGKELRVDDRVTKVLNKLKSSGVDIEALKKSYYDQKGLRSNRFGRVFSAQEIKARGTEYKNYIYSDAGSNGGNFTSLQGSPTISISDVKLQNITPISSGISSDGRSYVDAQIITGSGDKETSGTYRTYLSEKNSKSIGIYSNPFSQIDNSLDMTGVADNLYIHGGKKLAFKVVIQKSTDKLNDGSAQAWAYLGDGTQIRIPGAVGQTGSEAYARAKAYIQAADSQNLSRQDLIEKFIEADNK